MTRKTDIGAASLWLHAHRNPDASRAELRDSLGWSDRTFRRRLQSLECPTVTLVAWIEAMKAGKIPWDTLDTHGKIQWYNQIHDLMMIGTPPWTPSDYVDVTDDLRLVVPRGRTLEQYEKATHKEPVYDR